PFGTLGSYLVSRLPARVTVKDYTPHSYAGQGYDMKSDPLVVDKSNIASAAPTEPHGQQGFTLKFKNPLSFTYTPQGGTAHTITLGEAQVQMGDITTDGKTTVSAPGDVLVKVAWNYFLLESDGSKGVHNPAFTRQVVDSSVAALK
ncbi:MAG: hypothetical protein Q8O05_00905, partial [Chloroflexota bacterium]|nr:hypothetical protein [Chloroflexota bacterium]